MTTGSALDRELTFTRFNTLAAGSLQVVNLSLRGFASNIAAIHSPPADASLDARKVAKKRLPLFSLCSFGTMRSDAGSLRHDDNVTSINGIFCEHDEGALPMDWAASLLVRASISAFVYTSPSHTEEHQRYRIVLPCSKPCSPNVHSKLVARVNGALNGALAPESFTRSQAYYGGIVLRENYRTAFIEGRFIDEADDLDAGAIGKESARAKEDHAGDGAARDAGERIFGDKAPPFGTQEFLDGFNSLAATLDPNNRGDWINFGMWLKGAYGDKAQDLWIEWAMTADEPADEAEQKKRWSGFKPTKADARSYWKKVRATQDGFIEAAAEKLCQKYYLVTHAGKTAYWRKGYNADLKREEWVELSEPDLKRECHYSKAVRRFIYDPKKPFYPNGFYFDPTTTNWENGAINLWTGWAIKSQAYPWPTIEHHLREILASGNEEHYRYILNWCAFYAQNPHKAAEVALVFRGSKGVGKGMLGRALCSLAPAHSIQVSHSSQVTGRFNEHMHQTIMFFADEAFWAGDKAGEGQLKRMITEDTLVIEGKNKKIIKARNLLHIIIASNEDWVVPSSKGERRYAIFEVSDKMKGNEAYFKRLAEAYSGEEIQGFLHSLLNIDLDNWHPRNSVPYTAALNEQAEISEALAPEAAIRRWLNRGVLRGTNSAWGVANVLLLPWALHDATGIRVNKTNLPLALKKIAKAAREWINLGQDKNGKTQRRQVTAYHFPPLADARAMFDAKYPWDQSITEWQCEYDAESVPPLPDEDLPV